MYSGPMTLACLLFVAQADSDLHYVNNFTSRIPIKIPANERADIRQFQLWVSTDLGRNYVLRGRTNPDKEEFLFQAEQDGIYYFKLVTIHKSDPNDPSRPSDLEKLPAMKVLVDTTPPEVRVEATRTGDLVTVHWEIKESYPEPKTFKAEFRTPEVAEWKPIPGAIADATGTVSFRPGSNGVVTVSVSVEDKATNLGKQIREVPAVAAVAQVAVVTPGGSDPSLNVVPPPPPPPTETQQPLTQISTTTPQGVLPALPSGTTQPPTIPGAIAAVPPPSPQVITPPPPAPSVLPSQVQALPPMRQSPPVEPLAQSGVQGVQNVAVPTAEGGLPPVMYTNQPGLRLEFEVDKVGPSGVGAVEVYQTLDDGRTWTPCRVTPADVVLPDLAELQRNPKARGSVTVQLTREEVVYGFCLVVKNGAQNGKAAPQPGELPQGRVELDTRAPWAQLSRSTKPHPTRRDVVTLYWEARDRNLADKPITLEWSDRRDGGWTFIGDPELANTPSQIEWQVPQGLPPRVYLRLTVRDRAGNKTVVQRDEPVLIDLSVPEARIVGIGPVPKP